MKLIESINNYIIKPHIIDTRGRFAHYPSEAKVISRTDGELIGKCHRASWYNWIGEEPTNPVDARGRWTFAMGKMIEGGYIEYCKQLGIWAGSNIHFYDRIHNISGEADLFIFNNKSIEGVEIKTAYGYNFQKSIMKYPKLDNMLQAGIYLDYFPIAAYHLIYKARDTQEDVEYILTIEQDEIGRYLCVDGIPCKMFYIQDIYDQYMILGKYVIDKQIPPRDYTYGYNLEQSEERLKQGKITKQKFSEIKNGKRTDSDWQCVYCDHLDRCWSEKRTQLKLKKGVNNVGIDAV